ncbi:MAG: DUF2254 domain-containing protein [Geminicoccaceae bacterium]
MLDRSIIGLQISHWIGANAITVASASQILSAIAGSMMTIASLVFSLTLTTLTLASQQLGPRLIEWFMNNRLTQMVLGSYIGLFIFTLLGIGSVNSGDSFNPHITVVAAIAGTVGNLILLVIYVHRAATNIQADTVISGSGSALVASIESRNRLFRDHETPTTTRSADGELDPVTSSRSGYIQGIDFSTLRDLARKQDGVIRLERRIGDFVVDGLPLAQCWSPEGESVEEAVRAAFVFGPKRTSAQDIEFALRGLVEIALRALSPGINDPFTANACIDQIGSALVKLMHGPDTPENLADDNGVACLFIREPMLADFAATGFNAIRHAGADNELVADRLAETQLMLHDLARSEEHRNLWKTHLQRTLATAERCLAEPEARRHLQEKIQAGLRW